MSKSKEKLETFLISVLIYEGRHYSIQNMNSYVLIRLIDKKKCTKICKKTDSPYYNEYFTFEFKKTKLQKLLDNTLTLTVIQPASCWSRKKILGYISMDLATVWDQTDHQFYHKWAVISAEDFAGGPKGYLKVDISITTIGNVPKIPLIIPEDTDVIEGNLLLPEGMTLERQRANFIFKIFKGEDFMKQTKCCNKDVEPNVRLEILFVGLKAVTSIQKSTLNPVWNESIIFTELFPPLCQRIKITIKYVECLRENVQAVKYINLRYISNDNEYGFLPTFGPSYLYFYHDNAYAGKILASLDTVLHDESLGIPKSVTKQDVDYVKEDELWMYEDVLLFAAIFEVSHVPKQFKDKTLRIELHFGSTMQDVQQEAGDYVLRNKSVDYTPSNNVEDHYSFVDLNEQYPCLHIISSWPDFRRRFFLSNMIIKMTKIIKIKIDQIEDLFKQEAYYCTRENIKDKLIDVLDYLTISCRKFLDIINHKPNFITLLDRERLHWIIREMEDIEVQAKDIYNPLKRKKTFRKLTYLYKRLEFLIQDEQECYPDVFIWIVSGGKRITHVKLSSRDIIYSAIQEEKGDDCGVIEDLFFKIDGNKVKEPNNRSMVICKLNMFLWLGLERQKKFCFTNLPENFAIPEDSTESMPYYLIAKEKHIFQCRVYIYQGRIKPGDDNTGFSDPFIRVILKESCKKSRVVKKSLNPLWDQTIVFQDVILYGSRKHVKNHPPNVILEIFDKDPCCKEEYIGRIIIIPSVRLSNERQVTPKMKWERINDESENEKGEILCTTELFEVQENIDMDDVNDVLSIPDEIKPKLEKFRLEVLYWGFRLLKKIHHLPITRPNIEVCCLDSTLRSTTINYNRDMNFNQTGDHIDLYLPSEVEYSPPLIITLYDSRSFGRNTYGGIYISLIKPFLFDLMTELERTNKMILTNYSMLSFDSQLDLLLAARERQEKELQLIGRHVNKEEDPFINFEKKSYFAKLKPVKVLLNLLRKTKAKNEIKDNKIKDEEVMHVEEFDDEMFDWWTKYYNSLDPLENFEEMTRQDVNEIPTQEDDTKQDVPKKRSKTNETQEIVYKLKIYNNELESQPEFNGFTDTLQVFPMYKGKRTGDDVIDNENITGIFKGSLRIYKYDDNDDVKKVTPNGYDIRNGAFQEWPSNEREPFTLRVYCIRGIRLISKDKFGATDAYVSIKLGKQFRKYKEDYIPNQFNPIFGKCYELKGYFPEDNCLTISVWDHDKRSKDDLIGETKIDIENRFYTKHRARCGLAMDYTESGYSTWRGQLKPTQILESYCTLYNISMPIYTEDAVLIANRKFVPKNLEEKNKRIKKECIALYALNNWYQVPLIGYHLVPEHVETRSLYHPSKPGIQQGKLKMWIDIFPCRDVPPPPPIDVTPRQPISYEFRVIIWNMEDVLLNEDDFFTGERKSDIYVKGWMDGENREQCTDVHYRSLTGEGNFNWRFVFNFDYLSCEKKIVVQKSSKFDEDSELKYPCRLKLQVWDNDTFSRNDFLGSITLELSCIPRAAKTSKKCNLSLLSTNSQKINLFKVKTIKGWWPFRHFDKDANEYILAGKLEAEFELIPQEEADANPVGLARDEPQALPAPKRPEMSFSFFKNPLKALKYLCCKVYRCRIIICCIFFLFIIFLMLAVYSFPGYTIKRILGA